MREISPNVEASMHPTTAELATLKGKGKRNLGKKLRKRLKMAKGAAIRESKKEGKADAAERKRGQTATALTRKPEAKGGVFRIARVGIFPRSSLLGAGQAGFWEFGKGGSVG